MSLGQWLSLQILCLAVGAWMSSMTNAKLALKITTPFGIANVSNVLDK
jgi:hypothetical protein